MSEQIHVSIKLNATVTAEMCHELHKDLIANGDTNTPNTLELVSIIGGIDVILSHYLCATIPNDEITLTQLQLQQIYETMANYKKQCKDKPLETSSDKELVYHFNTESTYLHSLFGEYYGSKLLHNFIYNKMFLYPMFVLMNVGFLQFFRGYIADFFIIIPAFAMWLVTVPWLILLLLSVNIKAFKMITKSFDFWFKVIYMIIFVVTRFIYVQYIGTNIETSRRNIFWFTYDAIYGFIRLFVILIWSSLDALQLPLCMKLYLGVFISIVYSLNAFFISLYAESNGDDSIVHITDSISISLISYIESSSRIVAIFMWKQTILSILKKNRCILIKYSPVIRWFDVDKSKRNLRKSSNDDGITNDNEKDIEFELNDHQTVELTDLQMGNSNDSDNSNNSTKL